MSSRKLIAGGLALAAKPCFSVAQQHVGKHGPTLDRKGTGIPNYVQDESNDGLF